MRTSMQLAHIARLNPTLLNCSSIYFKNITLARLNSNLESASSLRQEQINYNQLPTVLLI